MLFGQRPPADVVVMFYTFAELPGGGGQFSPTPWGTFSTDLDVSPVYQVKTPEKTQAGNLNEEACFNERGGNKKGFTIWFRITAERAGNRQR